MKNTIQSAIGLFINKKLQPSRSQMPCNTMIWFDCSLILQVRVNSDQERFLIVPFGLLYSEVTASSLVRICADALVEYFFLLCVLRFSAVLL